MMFKILILQKYYNLSDEKTIWLFKEQLKKHKLTQKLFDLFTRTLTTHGIIAREGSIVDASFIDVPRQRNTGEENTDIKKGAVPLSFAKKDNKGRYSKLSQKDTNARWTTKNNERHYGYKDHINADETTKLITRFTVTSAAPHDSTQLENLITQEDKRLHADSAYRSKEIEAYLKTQACESQIHEKGYRGHPLTREQKASNTIKSKIRVRVEHIFGFMTNSMHNALFMRCIGRERIESQVGLLNLTYNLFRYEQLVRLKHVKMI